MEISTDILSVFLTAAIGGVGWLFKVTGQQAKDIVVLQTKIEVTNSQVTEIKQDIQSIRTELERANKESNSHMIQMIEAISVINTNVARLATEIGRDKNVQ